MNQIPAVVVWALGTCVVVALVLLFGAGGWEYYRAPLATRGYLPAHALLRPSGAIGLTLGVTGAVAMLSTLPYAVRKRARWLSHAGPVRHWLEVHIFFGIVGPILITFHSAFKFNGLIAAGYWLMMIVWASGFVGRYLYSLIPRSLRGVELTRVEIDERLDEVRAQIDAMAIPEAVRTELAVLRGRGLRTRVRLRRLRNQLAGAGADLHVLDEAVALATDRAVLARRAAHLHRTQRLFALWHVFHQPLVSIMFVIVVLHIGVALYLGYARLIS